MFSLPWRLSIKKPTKSPVTQTVKLQVKTNLNDLDLVLSWFAQLYQPQIPQMFWSQCQLALAEGFTNAVRHAHKGQSSEVPIDLEATLTPQGVELRIWDQGPPFDLNQWLSSMPEKIDEDALGGRGVKLMQDIADHLSYERTADSRNCLSIIKYYAGERGFNHNKIVRFS